MNEQEMKARIAELEAALEPFAGLWWEEEYTQPTPNVRVFVSRHAIKVARQVLGMDVGAAGE